MAEWSYGETFYRRYHDGSWGTDPVTIDAGEELLCQGWFSVTGGSGPVAVGWLHFEVDVGLGAGYVEWASQKYCDPARTLAGDPPAEIAGDRPLRNFVYNYGGGPFNTRVRVEWTDGDHYSTVIQITVNAPPVALGRVTRTARLGPRSFRASVPAMTRAARLGARSGTATLARRAYQAPMLPRVMSATVGAAGITRAARLPARTAAAGIAAATRYARLAPRTLTARVARRTVSARLLTRTLQATVVRNG